ncbi:hypothetical protein [Saccharibacillus sacchari]|uniref:Uncharacterized protein n=1 Tax=Saccharibacillus sacchari TaxID=456493 RepID=A0ACC6P7S4_9BACL
MKPAFANLFWGLLLVWIDIPFSTFDVFNDTVGYLLIAYGMHRISKPIPLFTFGRWLAAFLAILSIPTTFSEESVSLFDQPFLLQGTWWEIWMSGVLGEFALLLLIYTLCEGIGRLAKSRGENGLFEHMRGSGSVYLFSAVPLMLISPFLLNFDIEALPVILLILGGVSLIGMLLILYGLIRAGRDLHRTTPKRRLDIRV